MENKWTALSESLPESRTVDVLFQNDKWITDWNPKGIRIGFFISKYIIITANWDDTYYDTENINITPDAAINIKWKLIE